MAYVINYKFYQVNLISDIVKIIDCLTDHLANVCPLSYRLIHVCVSSVWWQMYHIVCPQIGRIHVCPLSYVLIPILVCPQLAVIHN